MNFFYSIHRQLIYYSWSLVGDTNLWFFSLPLMFLVDQETLSRKPNDGNITFYLHRMTQTAYHRVLDNNDRFCKNKHVRRDGGIAITCCWGEMTDEIVSAVLNATLIMAQRPYSFAIVILCIRNGLNSLHVYCTHTKSKPRNKVNFYDYQIGISVRGNFSQPVQNNFSRCFLTYKNTIS